MLTRFPFTHTVMLKQKLPEKLLSICPNPTGTQPVPYKNYKGRHSYGQLDKIDDKLYLIWYVWEFIGHMTYLSEDFDSFILKIAENKSDTGPGPSDFNNYFKAMISDCNTVYNRHILTHFDVMWTKCREKQETWNTKLTELREAFNTYIQKRMTEYEADTEEVHPVFGSWKETLIPIYGEHWGDYVWQCTNFDELGQFITQHNEYYRKNENAKELLCQLNIPEEKFNFCGRWNEPVAKIDGNEIKIWTRAVDCNGKTFVYPATPIEWTTGGGGIIPEYHHHRSIFPNGAVHWLQQCKEKEIEVKFILIHGDINRDSYENDRTTGGHQTRILCDNKHSAHRLTKPVCRRDESLADFSGRCLQGTSSGNGRRRRK